MINIAIIGLGYVGLPLFCLLSKHYNCIGLDKDSARISLLNEGLDYRECDKRHNIKIALQRNTVTTRYTEIAKCNVFIVCVPTGVDNSKQPDLTPLMEVCASLGEILKQGDLVIFESTVYPGATNDVCVPILERYSNLTIDKDFSVGYSPERINVGDKPHKIASIPKIISASNATSLCLMDKIYSCIIDAPIIRASSIKVAEAAKMYENVQRDVLIALANEYSEFCKSNDISITEVTECAASKWNFAKVYPGLVGGHCIGVDPYYLLNKASSMGVDLPLITTARNTNENKVNIVAKRVVSMLEHKDCRVLIMGVTYKANTADCRNSKVFDLVDMLTVKGIHVDCYDPVANKAETKKLPMINDLTGIEDYTNIIVCTKHKVFTKLLESLRAQNLKINAMEELL
jgi:UDP-N-acetyl-D-galactosamine dehydrogenase